MLQQTTHTVISMTTISRTNPITIMIIAKSGTPLSSLATLEDGGCVDDIFMYTGSLHMPGIIVLSVNFVSSYMMSALTCNHLQAEFMPYLYIANFYTYYSVCFINYALADHMMFQ